MSLFNIFDVAGSALSAQSIRLNTVASNLANAEAASSSAEQTYRARQPVFRTTYDAMLDNNAIGVRVERIFESDAPARQQYQPGHPLADEKGYVYFPNVNAIEEMTNMISASRSFQTNVEVMNTSKQLLLRTLSIGQ